MKLFSGEGYFVYGVSSITAFVSGLMPFLILLSAAAFAGASDNWTHLFELALGIWALCFVVPLVLIASRFRFAPWFAVVGSSLMVLYCAYWLLVVAKHGQSNPLIVGKVAIPIWLWVATPIPFNAIQAAVSFMRFRELSLPSR
jgi:hypothetical protein